MCEGFDTTVLLLCIQLACFWRQAIQAITIQMFADANVLFVVVQHCLNAVAILLINPDFVPVSSHKGVKSFNSLEICDKYMLTKVEWSTARKCSSV